MTTETAPLAWTDEELIVARMFERVMGNLVAQAGHDNMADVILTTMLIGVDIGAHPVIGPTTRKVIWRMIEAFGPAQERTIRGAVGGFVSEIQKILRVKPWAGGG